MTASPAETHAHDPSAMDSQWCCDFICPNPTLHTVEGAPIQALADLLRTATEFDEIADYVFEYGFTDDTRRLFTALRAAVRALSGGAS